MKNLLITGTGGSGKTAVALGLALKLRQQGYRVSYFKPVGTPPPQPGGHDLDAALMKKVLNLDFPLETIVPFTAGPSYLSGYRHCQSMEKVMDAYATVSSGYDIVIIGSASFPHIMGCLGLDTITLSRELKALALFVIHIENDYSLDNAIFINNYFACQALSLLGNIFNSVPRPLMAKTQGVYQKILEERGYSSLGIIPRNAVLASPTVTEYLNALGGEVLTGENNLDNPVEDVVIGAMNLESALGYFRRSPNKAVITGGDRADIALAALETSTSVLVLTGGLFPDLRVLARATEKGVPVLLVHHDTYTTLEKCTEVYRRIEAKDRNSVSLTLENIEKYCRWQDILQAIK